MDLVIAFPELFHFLAINALYELLLHLLPSSIRNDAVSNVSESVFAIGFWQPAVDIVFEVGFGIVPLVVRS